MSDDARAELVAMLTDYIRREFLDPQDADALTSTTPLLEWGVLSSSRLARLVAHLRSEMGVRIPMDHMVGKNFRDIESIVDLITELRTVAS